MDKPLLNGETNVYPTLKKAKDEKRVIVYVDECACYLLPLLVHSWAPKGQTPIVIEQAGRSHLSLIAAIAPNGRIYVAGQDQPFSGEDIAWFLRQLCSRYRKRDLLVIWDGAAIHRSESVKELLRKRPGRIHLEPLPAYSPELNPVELVWSHLKRSLKNQVFANLEELTIAILEQVKRLEENPELIRAFFNKEEIAFITD
ncbi:IS630 family transposase [Spirosoma sp. RP8]|uniref:IS630 family transposase n=1 Tax=Spirosoma liriopis TaxID=2937440 RepID=A0ABT0HWS2_9BACT|nr:IS630 family transposase [Spirosoma liriopis]MCK8496073.1 IS630 family transposase [Spirosoma liriopis]